MTGARTLRTGWWFEDALPGSTLVHPQARTIGDADHVWLAWLTNNASDVHGNVDRARAGPWGGPLVLGALSVAIVIGLAQPAEGEPDHWRQAVAPEWRMIRLGGPVRPGDTLRAVSHIESRAEMPGAGGGLVERTVVGTVGAHREVVRISERTFAPSCRQRE